MNQNRVSIGKFSLGMGDRFAQEAQAQLRACIMAADAGIEVAPVWNKSNREHTIVGSEPSSVRAAAEAAVKQLGWKRPWHIDADHIRLETVNRFVEPSDFFTIDVADSIGRPAAPESISQFVAMHRELQSHLQIPGIERDLELQPSDLERVAAKYLVAVQDAAAIFRHIEQIKGQGRFIVEVSMDETDIPQSPVELLVILAALADAEVPVQTIAPRFSGRFNKGVDYVGNVGRFEQEFNDDVCVLKHAVAAYGLPANLKLSVHSGSDKFSIYPAINRAIKKHNAGLHLKTAGTTWLEEVIGLAESGSAGLALAKEIYAAALEHIDELCAPYATVIDIDRSGLPAPSVVAQWTSGQYVRALRHDQSCGEFNPHLRQLIHVGFKIAAKMGSRYLDLVRANQEIVAKNVTFNLFDRHIKPVFLA